MVKLLQYILIFTLFTPLLAQGENSFGLIKNTEHPIYLNSSAVYYEDNKGDKDISIIKTLNQSNFKALDEIILQDNNSNVWVKFSASNHTRDKQFVLKLSSWQHGDLIDVYVYKKDRLIQHSKSGFFEKRDELDYPFSNETSKAKLFLPSNDTLSIFIKYQTKSGFGTKPELCLVKEQEIFNTVRVTGMIHGVFQGLLWLIALFSLTFFLFLGDRVFLYYFLYVSFFSLYFLGKDGYLFELILPNNPALANLIFASSSMFSSSFFLLFIRQLIIEKKELTHWIKGHLMLFYIFFSMALVSIVFLSMKNIKVSFYLINLTLLISAVYLYPFIYKFSKQRDPVSRHAFIATLIIILFFTVGLASLQFNIHVGEVSAYAYMKIGVTIELLFFNIAIGYRYYTKEVENRKTRENLIEQLRLNQAIKDEMNADLENQVVLRTTELESQKAETEAQRDDIYSKNIILQDRNEEISIQNETIERNHKLLTDSLNYARIIQTSIIPTKKKFNDLFSDSFVYSKPKDVVSGDFYWLNKDKNKIHIAVADCTGHGVPGAMLSVLGLTSIDKISKTAPTIKPNIVLESLRIDFISTLKQEKELIGKDGMDISFCTINYELDELLFSSAQQSAYIIRDNSIIKLESSKQPIARYIRETSFTNKSYPLVEGDMVYLFTDGYYDQMGGEEGKKFMSKRFKQLLIHINTMNCDEQYAILSKTIKKWQGSVVQTDDMTVIGFRYQKPSKS